ncbi:hypothetical protein [Flavobacterium cellulosilyticum]|uniref:Fibronectin type-III domain-containing protein n=1 Tax=Flavobacterium cellulosilyticum TaxID=2541731 RepID=A0A4R5C6T8_9FLAO|nr:hypothetical protein [Flavobacterium cellulosilyticum]TDD93833.1 hypothetical protein E0F76_18385 [Flavobacterium cellulosilyticum]
MKYIYIIGIVLLSFSILSCSNTPLSDEKVVQIPSEVIPEKTPEVSTIEVLNIDVKTATINAKVINKGSASVTKRGVCLNTIENPTIENGVLYPETITKATGEFSANLFDLQDNTKYYIRAYAINKVGVGYGNQIVFDTKLANIPVLKMGNVTISGVHDLFVDVKIVSNGDFPIVESGVTWDLNENPIIENNKTTVRIKDNLGGFLQRITNLQELKKYFVRPYAKTIKGVTYGNQISVSTIKSGKFTFYMWEDPVASTETKAAYVRIRAAFEDATYYYNNFTSVEKHLTINYSPGTPTADGNISGWINMGSNQSYQRTGTAMHEIAHTIGVGTHGQWGILMKGTWQGNRVKEILRVLTGSTTSELLGDGQHFWPYGINGANEDNGDEMLYITNALILQGMKTDGLPSN